MNDAKETVTSGPTVYRHLTPGAGSRSVLHFAPYLLTNISLGFEKPKVIRAAAGLAFFLGVQLRQKKL